MSPIMPSVVSSWAATLVLHMLYTNEGRKIDGQSGDREEIRDCESFPCSVLSAFQYPLSYCDPNSRSWCIFWCQITCTTEIGMHSLSAPGACTFSWYLSLCSTFVCCNLSLISIKVLFLKNKGLELVLLSIFFLKVFFFLISTVGTMPPFCQVVVCLIKLK